LLWNRNLRNKNKIKIHQLLSGFIEQLIAFAQSYFERGISLSALMNRYPKFEDAYLEAVPIYEQEYQRYLRCGGVFLKLWILKGFRNY